MNKDSNRILVRLILPSGVKEIHGSRQEVIEEMHRLIDLESDIGKSFAEIILITPQQEQLQFGSEQND